MHTIVYLVYFFVAFTGQRWLAQYHIIDTVALIGYDMPFMLHGLIRVLARLAHMCYKKLPCT
jgi:hypothetical protein